jgi:predicted ArsR family transcriptional regulator
MREAAATGSSGLGQVTEKENQMLASVIEDLRAYQDTDQLKTGLARTKAAMYLLAHNDFKTQADFDKALGKMSEEILAEQFNKTSKVKVTPR